MVARQPLAGEVMAAVLALGGKAEETALRQQFSDEPALQKALRYLTGKKLLAAQEDFLHKSADKTEQMVCLAVEPAMPWNMPPESGKQRRCRRRFWNCCAPLGADA